MQINLTKGASMPSAPRFTHSFSLNEPDELILQEALKKMPKGYGIIDIVKEGIKRFRYAKDIEALIEKSRDVKLKK